MSPASFGLETRNRAILVHLYQTSHKTTRQANAGVAYFFLDTTFSGKNVNTSLRHASKYSE
jgi:hypothetical protein